MYLQATDLKEFYEGLQGRVVQRILRQQLRLLWPQMKNMRVVGLGYALPFLRPWVQDASSVIALMPQQMGAVFWPPDEKGLVSICDDGELPIETNSVDRLLIVHALESYDNIDAVLKEAWRVLKAQGSLILIVPNRTGIWARFDNTPFGYGNPYSAGQLRDALKDYMFVPERVERCLFLPPTSSRVMLSLATILEKIGRRFFNAFGGVNVVEATKQLYGGTLVGATTGVRPASRRRIVTSPRPLSRLGRRH